MNPFKKKSKEPTNSESPRKLKISEPTLIGGTLTFSSPDTGATNAGSSANNARQGCDDHRQRQTPSQPVPEDKSCSSTNSRPTSIEKEQFANTIIGEAKAKAKAEAEAKANVRKVEAWRSETAQSGGSAPGSSGQRR